MDVSCYYQSFDMLIVETLFLIVSSNYYYSLISLENLEY